jgi:hypothetical protein
MILFFYFRIPFAYYFHSDYFTEQAKRKRMDRVGFEQLQVLSIAALDRRDQSEKAG